MKRLLLEKLIGWKDRREHFPLVLKGARQVGKTHLVSQFGREYFVDLHTLNFETTPRLKTIFAESLDPKHITKQIELFTGEVIRENSLLFFDEVQECPQALTALKAFAEGMPQQAIISAGSLLGVSLPEASFPVGKVEYLWLGPFTFEEFLEGIDDQPGLEMLQTARKGLQVSTLAHEHLWEKLKSFYVTGGLPRPILTFNNGGGASLQTFREVRTVQQALIRDYMSDFSKYTLQANAAHIRSVYENVSEQLSLNEDRTTSKYVLSKAVKGLRGYSDLRGPIDWLVRAGLVYKVRIANRGELPFAHFSKDSFFKLYHFDVGLFGALLNLPPTVLQTQDYGMAKGYFAESLVLQGLVTNDLETPFCWTEGQAEVEFMLATDIGVVPVEVKSASRTKAKSLDSFLRRYRPKLAIKLANCKPHYNQETKVLTLPLYLAWDVMGIVDRFVLNDLPQ